MNVSEDPPTVVKNCWSLSQHDDSDVDLPKSLGEGGWEGGKGDLSTKTWGFGFFKIQFF